MFFFDGFFKADISKHGSWVMLYMLHHLSNQLHAKDGFLAVFCLFSGLFRLSDGFPPQPPAGV